MQPETQQFKNMLKHDIHILIETEEKVLGFSRMMKNNNSMVWKAKGKIDAYKGLLRVIETYGQ